MCSFTQIHILYVCITIKFYIYTSYSIMLHTVLLLLSRKSEIAQMFMTVHVGAFHSYFTVKNVKNKKWFLNFQCILTSISTINYYLYPCSSLAINSVKQFTNQFIYLINIWKINNNLYIQVRYMYWQFFIIL